MLDSALAIIIVLGLCLMFHEGGHFAAAKLARMKVEEFGIGFPIPPRLGSFTRGETRYSFYWLLIGAFVRISGMEPGEENVPHGFYTKSVWRRATTLLGGPVMNILLAGLFFWTLGVAFGEATGVENVVARVLPGEPAEKAGVRAGDRILAIDDHWHSTKVERVEPDGLAARAGIAPGDVVWKVNGAEVADYHDMLDRLAASRADADVTVIRDNDEGGSDDVSVRLPRLTDLDGALAAAPRSRRPARLAELGLSFAPLEWDNTVALTQRRGGREMKMTVLRDGKTITLTMVPRKVLVKSPEVSDDGHVSIKQEEIGRVGITPVITYRKLGLLDSAWWGAKQTYTWVRGYAAYFALMVRGKADAEFSGPIGIAREIGESAKLGPSHVLRIGGIISLIIGILNLVPFPGLDGWCLATTAYEAVFRRPPNRKREAMINAIGITILVVALIAVCFKDVIEIIVSRSVQ
ncbi:MAG: site-2 protease family protein [Armatimonadota bacterium]